MAHDVRNPLIFVDGPGNTASGDQVMTNFDALWAAVDPAFNTYQRIQRGAGQVGGSTAAATLILPLQGSLGMFPAANASASVGSMLFELDPAEHVVSGRTTKLNLRLTAVPNATAPAVTFTAGLYPISSFAGGAGVGPIINTLGAVVAGSQAAVASPGVNARSTGSSGDFTIPSAAAYCLAVLLSGTTALNSVTELVATLSLRRV